MRELGVISSDGGLHAALRARVEELGVTLDSVDRAAGFTTGYASKLLAPSKIKRLGTMSRWALIGALGCSMVLIVDEKATARLFELERVLGLSRQKLRRRAPSVLRSNGVHRNKPNYVTRRFLREIGRMGGLACAAARRAAHDRSI